MVNILIYIGNILIYTGVHKYMLEKNLCTSECCMGTFIKEKCAWESWRGEIFFCHEGTKTQNFTKYFCVS